MTGFCSTLGKGLQSSAASTRVLWAEDYCPLGKGLSGFETLL